MSSKIKMAKVENFGSIKVHKYKSNKGSRTGVFSRNEATLTDLNYVANRFEGKAQPIHKWS